MSLIQNLKKWQEQQAQKEGVESYKVLPFATLMEIARQRPQTRVDLLAIKGIGPVKARKYASALLALVAGESAGGQAQQPTRTLASSGSHVRRASAMKVASAVEAMDSFTEAAAVNDVLAQQAASDTIGDVDPETGEVLAAEDAVLSVTDFVGALNNVLGAHFGTVRIRGEVTGFKRNRNGHAYFELKDAESLLRCAVFRTSYDLSGVDMADGLEIIITGHPQYHAQYGFSVIGSTVELVGEGALKAAYEKRKKKLAAEGLLAPERKRAVSPLPQRIGLITSRTGQAIHDFLQNVGTFGYTIAFTHASVEGQQAVPELMKAIALQAQQDLDALVIVRGGGSIESLQAFNNERLVRAIADFPVPVIVGVGHDQDETLATLVADAGTSTPTAAARAVRESWDAAAGQVARHEQVIVGAVAQMLSTAQQTLDQTHASIDRFVARLRQHADAVFLAYDRGLEKLATTFVQIHERLDFYDRIITLHNPMRQLKRGYSIVTDQKGKVVRKTNDVAKGDYLIVCLQDGVVETEVIE